jgi:hypothetical protein
MTTKPQLLALLPTTTLHTVFNVCTREELRNIARPNGIRRGQNKSDTLRNLTDPNGRTALALAGVTVKITYPALFKVL